MTKPSDEITDQAVADQQLESASNQTETDTVEASGAEATAEPEGTIPEKFRGKTALEIAEAYRNLERQLGKIASEKSHAEKAAEETRQRLAQIEQRMQIESQQRQQQVPTQSDPDPFSNIDEELEVDPKAAIKKIADFVKQTPKQLRGEVARQQRETLANDYYARQMKDNPDFRQLEPDMKRLALQHGHLIHPDRINSPETMELLYKLAKSENMSSYQKQAADKAIQASNLVRDEKRRAVSESGSGGTTTGSSRFEDLSIEEMRKALERAS